MFALSSGAAFFRPKVVHGVGRLDQCHPHPVSPHQPTIACAVSGIKTFPGGGSLASFGKCRRILHRKKRTARKTSVTFYTGSLGTLH